MNEHRAFASLSSGLLARKGAARPAMRPQGMGQSGSLDDLGWNDMGHDRGEAVGDGGVVEGYDPSVGLTAGSPVHAQQVRIIAQLSGYVPGDGGDEEDIDETAELYEPDVDGDEDEAIPARRKKQALDLGHDSVEPVPSVLAVDDEDEQGEPDDSELLLGGSPASTPLPRTPSWSDALFASVPPPAPAQPMAEPAPLNIAAAAETQDGEDVPDHAAAEMHNAFAELRRTHALAGLVSRQADLAPDTSPARARAKTAFTLRLDADRHLRLRLACALDGRSAQALVTEALDRFLNAMPGLDAVAARKSDQ